MSNNDELSLSDSVDLLTSTDKKLKLRKQKRPDKQLYIPPRSKNTKSEFDGGSNSKQEKSESSNTMKVEPSWDSLYDDNGDVVDSEFLNDLNSELGIKAISSQLASSKLDYSKFCDPVSVTDDLNDEECGNVLEIYDFSSDLKTRDLIISLSATKYMIAHDY